MDPSSSSPSLSRSKYDVFLSFRGQDTRHTIISHLYHALCQKGISTFHDRSELKSGDRRDKLFEAIEGSRVAIIMFSENYARSKWCLNELAKIMEQQKLDKIKALPIFYRVSPGEVRLHEKDTGEKGCYQIAMEVMETRYHDDPEMVERWRKALWLGGDLIGYPMGIGQDENSVVQDTVKAVLKTLNRVPLEVATYPVGIDRHVKEIKKLLHIDPHANDVLMLGLHGQGGAGKTTLSKGICNDIAKEFDSWCFLRDIRKRASNIIDGLEHLQLMLLRDLLSEEGLTVSSVDQGKHLIKERLSNKRVLVILDDVDDGSQFDALAGNLNWFGAGSRIIITTRNRHVLSLDRVQHVYHVDLLSKEEATTLFRLHAFSKIQGQTNIDQKLVDSFVQYAKGLPLALEVLGRYLRGRGAKEWEGKLKELANSPDPTINSALKISLEGLEDPHKEMFLDVACFFKGWNAEDVEKILDSCGFVTSLGMNILIERSLVKVVDGKIEMHDLQEEMGQSIIRGVCFKDRSRIWRYDDFLEILSEDSGTTQAVEGIVLNFSEKKVLDVESTIEFDSSSKLVGLDIERSQVHDMKGTGFEELKYVNLSRMSATLLERAMLSVQEKSFQNG
ncbi:hypothetical protein MLD38_020402 [Melastoma candidum]|uniref:Uncharacterized protein n=1 Tax=Melastoma candidum TaxID=119954 RepID=A0ACB9QD35_9MYRT|nr:hypothetical protein MLD38_020402 [Melastoma candidum]